MATSPPESLLEEAMKLPEAERTKLVSALLASLDAAADEEWAAELDRRAQAVREGTAVVDSWPNVRERLQRRMRK